MEELENVINADDKVRNILDRENQILIATNVDNRNNVNTISKSPVINSGNNINLSPM